MRQVEFDGALVREFADTADENGMVEVVETYDLSHPKCPMFVFDRITGEKIHDVETVIRKINAPLDKVKNDD